MDIGERLRSLRKKRGETQAELGVAVGASRNSVHRWEKGLSYPGAPAIKSLADYYGVSAEWLRNGGAEADAVPEKSQHAYWVFCYCDGAVGGIALLCPEKLSTASQLMALRNVIAKHFGWDEDRIAISHWMELEGL